MKTKRKLKKPAKKAKLAIHHRIHRHIKKHLTGLKKKRPHVHKALVLMSITLPLVLGAVLFGSSALYYYESYMGIGSAKEKISVNLPMVQDDTTDWKTYKDDLSGFSIKYSNRWDDPEVGPPSDNSKYIRKISFDNGFDSQDKEYNGFEVYVYDAKKFHGPVSTDNLIPKSPGSFELDNCDKAEFGEASVGENDYPAQEVDVSVDDKCFQPTYFFSVSKGKYVYNIVPKVNINNPIADGIKSDVIAEFPKFFELLSTITLQDNEITSESDTVDSSPSVNNRARTNLVPPHRTLIRLGRCPNKHDRPRYSKTKHHRHMDEDCCMDPDEWPNPRCQY